MLVVWGVSIDLSFFDSLRSAMTDQRRQGIISLWHSSQRKDFGQHPFSTCECWGSWSIFEEGLPDRPLSARGCPSRRRGPSFSGVEARRRTCRPLPGAWPSWIPARRHRRPGERFGRGSWEWKYTRSVTFCGVEYKITVDYKVRAILVGSVSTKTLTKQSRIFHGRSKTEWSKFKEKTIP